ncbi:HsdM family class I SAM-dependent methyltransferase [Flavobacterium psychrophilum]|uniref:HsdM family class I SAM-dependent methyltransferase n=3 Tax=Flavobacterium psychrophilum TaxID=96345 RepID=UPI001C8FA122|nr:N-6 DNA methylase [Flavobacterium psychrophilum]EKT4499683.1 N-6 DNA methylase [Flavobacterium psychrophilum]QZK99290.1 SAM-dependent methyltransferase [Flavobacterium psychrophilum]
MNSSIINNLDIIDFAKDCNVFDIDLFENEKFGVVKVYGNEDQPALFLKEVDSFNFKTLKQIAEIQKASWNFQKVLFLYVYTKTEIRIYNCSEKPFGYEENIQENEFTNKLKELELYSCKETDNDKLKKLNILFSRIAIDTGFIWSSIEAKEIKDKINLQNRVDKFLIQSLINVSRELEEQGLTDKNLIHKLVMRSLFLLYLEDRGATKKEFYGEFSLKAESYLDLLKQGEVNHVYSLFEKLAEDFNGSLFNIEENEINLVTREHLDLIRQCFTSGYTKSNQIKLFSDWRLFNFSIIRIELLSEIYENFLSELDKKAKKNTGTFYTPPSLVELILNEKLPVRNNETDYKVKTLDPSCGSGIFLVQSFKRLVKRYENKHKSKLNDFNILIDILKSNIFGIELDGKSIKVAAFSLYLALLDNLDPKTDWWNGTIKFPYLINDNDDESLKEQGNNLFKRDTISDLSEIKKLQNFDLIVGNPPFGTKKLLPTITAYCEKENFAKEMVLPFLHKATLLAPKGKIALIFNTKVLTNTGGTYQNFRKWLFNKKYVEKIYNFSILRKAPKFSGGQLFGSAVGPISIVFYQNETPENSKDTITYYAPKTYIKNDVLEGIVIDSSDEKHLPRIECKKPNSKIWKIAMWGSFFDFELIEKLFKTKSLKNDLRKNNIKNGVGFQLLTNKKDKNIENQFISDNKYLDADYIERFTSNASNLKGINTSIKTKKAKLFYGIDDILINDNKFKNISFFRRLGDLNAYLAPHLLLKKGLIDNQICASYLDEVCTFRDGVYGFYSLDKNENYLKALTTLLNSKISSYLLFLTISSYGIEREQIMKNEFLTLPYAINEDIKLNLVYLFNKIFQAKKADDGNGLLTDITNLEKQIDQIIYNDILKLTENEQIVIQDTLNYSLDLFEKQEKSKAVLPVNNIDVYSKRITKEINDWLDDDDLNISVTHYKIDRNCPLYLVKLSFGNQQKETQISKENIYQELKKIDKKLWNKESDNLYFRKKLNYFDGDDIYIIKPNQRRFWSQTVAMEDSKSLLVEILNMKE